MSPSQIAAILTGIQTDPTVVLQADMASLQTQSNNAYNNAVSVFKSASDSWIQANITNRAEGNPISTFTMSIPKHTIYSIVNGAITSVDVQDPNLQLPQLPPQASTDAHNTFQTAGGTDPNIMAMLAYCVQSLQALRQKEGV